MTYTAKGKTRHELLDDYEKHLIDADQGGNTIEYLHAALMSRAADDQQRWAMIGSVAACVSVVVAVVAVVALLVSLSVI